jgi:hypothetical protein
VAVTLGDSVTLGAGHWVSDNAVWMGKLVAVGEVVIGVCLLLGLFTGVFAFLGLVLNFSFVFSGSAGVNPAFIIVGLLLVLAWRYGAGSGWTGSCCPGWARPGSERWPPGPTTRCPPEQRSHRLRGASCAVACL